MDFFLGTSVWGRDGESRVVGDAGSVFGSTLSQCRMQQKPQVVGLYIK